MGVARRPGMGKASAIVVEYVVPNPNAYYERMPCDIIHKAPGVPLQYHHRERETLMRMFGLLPKTLMKIFSRVSHRACISRRKISNLRYCRQSRSSGG